MSCETTNLRGLSRRVAACVTLLSAAGLLGCPASEPPGGSGQVVVREARIPAPPPGSPAAGYFVLVNESDADRTFTGANSDATDRIEIHETRIVDGVASMSPIDRITIAAGDTLHFAPRGHHLMLYPARPLAAGDHVMITLASSDGDPVMIHANVEAPGGSAAGDAEKGHDVHAHH